MGSSPLPCAPLLGADGDPGPMSMFLLPLLVVGVLYYLMVIRPEHAQRAEQVAERDKLKQNDRVITAGGIHGVVVKASAGEPDIVLRIDDSTNTRIRIQRASVSRVVTTRSQSDDSDSS